MPEAVLVVTGLSRFFGGLAAVNDVSLELYRGEIHAVIGPNGAGKTTFINLLSGELAPTAGSVRYEGKEIAGLPPEHVARLGIAHSYQRTNIFTGFSVFENCRLAAQARLSGSLRFIRPALAHRAIHDAAERVLSLVGLSGGARLANTLSHGEQRQLEIAMTLATDPKVLLLDEPLAGMSADEGKRMVELINELGRDYAVMLVEHDMDAVFSIAKRLTVMANGRVIESGAPHLVRRSAKVQEAYLGRAGELA